MTEREALLAAILAQPDEDLPRLMYADEIEEANPTRAEFIRVQVEQDRQQIGQGWSSNVEDWIYRQVVAHGVEWAAGIFPFDDAYGRWVTIKPGGNQQTHMAFKRGFIEEARCPAADWLAHADQVLATYPVQDVTLTTMPGHEWHSTDTNHPAYGRSFWIVPKELVEDAERDLMYPIASRDEMTLFWLKSRWPTVKTWHLPPQDRLGEMFRYVAGNFAALGYQQPPSLEGTTWDENGGESYAAFQDRMRLYQGLATQPGT